MSIDRAASGFKSDDAERTEQANEGKNPPGESLAGGPGHSTDESNYSYRGKRHEFNGEVSAETSPSAGWKRVYAEMEVRVNGQR